MREILFRGKRLDNGEWVYGYVFTLFDRPVIKFGESDKELVGVIPETVGEFTGLTDKNSNKIFEGDIVVTRFSSGEICCIGDVQFDCGVFGAEWTIHKKTKFMVGGFGQLHNLRRFDDDIIEDIEIIGNIHNNPELLGETK